MARKRSLPQAPWGLPLGAARALSAALAMLCACGPGTASTLVVVTISGVPDGTRMLRATSYLDGRREQDPAELDGRQRQLVVRLPPGASGLYRLEIDALAEDGCSFAQGQADATVGSERRIELRIALGSRFPSCILAVRKTGLGQGYVESDPFGISCGTREGGEVQECAYSFQQGVSVRLVARPSARASFDGWTDACTGVDPCEVTMTVPRSVTASFGVRAQ